MHVAASGRLGGALGHSGTCTCAYCRRCIGGQCPHERERARPSGRADGPQAAPWERFCEEAGVALGLQQARRAQEHVREAHVVCVGSSGTQCRQVLDSEGCIFKMCMPCAAERRTCVRTSGCPLLASPKRQLEPSTPGGTPSGRAVSGCHASAADAALRPHATPCSSAFVAVRPRPLLWARPSRWADLRCWTCR